MWNERYSRPDYIYGTEPNDFLREEAERLAVGDTLCIAEGEGRNGVFLAGLGHRVTGVDAAQAGLAKAQKLAAQKGVSMTTQQVDLRDYEFAPDSWDNIVSIFCHLPPDLRKQVHAGVVRSLRPGGHFILEAYTVRQLELATGGPPDAELMMDIAMLKQDLAGLDFEIAREVTRDVSEGAFHHGTGAVVQLVARKPLVVG